jgi:hypothetical protein
MVQQLSRDDKKLFQDPFLNNPLFCDIHGGIFAVRTTDHNNVSPNLQSLSETTESLHLSHCFGMSTTRRINVTRP